MTSPIFFRNLHRKTIIVSLLAGAGLSRLDAGGFYDAANALDPLVYYRLNGDLSNTASGPNSIRDSLDLLPTPAWEPSFLPGPCAPAFPGFQNDNKGVAGMSDTNKLVLGNGSASTLNSALDGAPGITCSVWVYLSSLPSNTWYLMNGLGLNTAFTFGITPTGAMMGARSVDADNYQYIDREYGFEKNIWYHVVGVADFANGVLSIYVNGEPLDASGVANWGNTSISLPSSGGFALGSSCWGTGYSGEGILDEAIIFKRALGEKDISALYKTSRKENANPGR